MGLKWQASLPLRQQRGNLLESIAKYHAIKLQNASPPKPISGAFDGCWASRGQDARNALR